MAISILIVVLATLLVSALGWKKLVYFFSLGYGYSIAAIAVALCVRYWQTLTWITGAFLLLMFIYGVRLATFLLVRELKSPTYTKATSFDKVNNEDRSILQRAIIWLSCALLYLCQTFPITAQLEHNAEGLFGNPIWEYVGLAVAFCGFVLEIIADYQKSQAKKVNPKRFVDTGVYRLVRCPNYLGELTVWTGVMISGCDTLYTWWQWLLAILGYIGIVYVMLYGAKRLERRQDKNYGSSPEYQSYKRRTPILFPFLPIYSFMPYSWMKG